MADLLPWEDNAEKVTEEQSEGPPLPDFIDTEPVSIDSVTMMAFPGIAMGGFWYAVSWYAIAAFLTVGNYFLNLGNGNLNLSDLVEGPIILLAGFCVTVITGVAFALLAGIIANGFVLFFNMSMQHVWSGHTTAGLAGGLAGYIATIAVPATFYFEGFVIGFVYSMVLGPVIAMVFGQVFAHRAVVKEIEKVVRRRKMFLNWMGVESTLGIQVNEKTDTDISRFNIRQLLAFTFWFALLTSISKAAMLLHQSVWIFFVLYPLIQIPIYLIVRSSIDPWIRKRLIPLLSPHNNTEPANQE